MHLSSVNVGKKQKLLNAKSSGATGIFKEPTSQPVQIDSLGLQGDYIDDKKHHGGVDQAVYIYGDLDYGWWTQEIGRDLMPGTFGDNLTIAGLESADMSIGDRLYIGDEVVLEVTAPRIPCVTLATRMGDPQFAKRFRHAERPGLYCRVITMGVVQKGDRVRIEPYTGAALSVREMFRMFFKRKLTLEDLKRQRNAPIDRRSRRDVERRLAGLENKAEA